MIKETIKLSYGDIPVLTNESNSKKMLLFFHGLDGSASFSRPLFKNLNDFKVVAIESRGHENSPLPASRSTKKHLNDYYNVIKYYKNQGYKIWVLGESMGGSYASEIAYKTKDLVETVFAQSIPNRLVNIMLDSRWKQFKIQFMTALSFFTNIKYEYGAKINYKKLSSSRLLQRLATIADLSKTRHVRETLATWSMNKRIWRKYKHKKPLTKIIYFQGEKDALVYKEKTKQILARNNISSVYIKDGYHILLYEANFSVVLDTIKKEMNKPSTN